nr:hypothetical protein [uncultured Roseovarius sp.]
MTEEPQDEIPGEVARAVFYERRTYRRRRMVDATRLLPILGVVLFLIPLLWQGEEGARTTDVMIYIFGIWALLAGLSGLVSRDLGRDRSGSDSEAGADVDALETPGGEGR